MPIQGSLQDITSKRKEVYKPILDNPFTKSSEWPVVAPNVAEHVMDSLSQLLSRYGNHLDMAKTSPKAPVPEEAKHIHLGFNSVVQVLEKQAAPNRARVLKKKPTPLPQDWGYVKYVFVTKADVSTGLLTDLFPMLTLSASQSATDRVKLVELPKGASGRLSKVLHSEHVNFLALSRDWKNAKFLFDYIDEHLDDVKMPWLEGIFDGGVSLDSTYQRPNIKFVKTSAPMGKGKNTKKNTKKNSEKNEGKKNEGKKNEGKKNEERKKPRLDAGN